MAHKQPDHRSITGAPCHAAIDFESLSLSFRAEVCNSESVGLLAAGIPQQHAEGSNATTTLDLQDALRLRKPDWHRANPCTTLSLVIRHPAENAGANYDVAAKQNGL